MADTYQLRVTISRPLADRLALFIATELRKESNAVELLLSEAFAARDDKDAGKRR